MGVSDFEFSDDDEVFLRCTVVKNGGESGKDSSGAFSSQFPLKMAKYTPDSTLNETISELPDHVKDRLYKADGQIAILKSQLDETKSQNYNQVVKLKQEYDNNMKSMEEQINDLKTSIQILQDEKIFLDNEVRSGFAKRRRVLIDVPTPKREPQEINQKVLKVQNETTLLIDHIRKLTINGASRTTMNYLSKVCLENDMIINNFKFPSKLPLSGILIEYLISQKDLRLDILFENFLGLLINLIGKLVDNHTILSVPFLLSLIHGTLMFKPLATKSEVIIELTEKLVKLTRQYSYNLNPEEIINMNINLTLQEQTLEKFIIICAMDIIETLMGFTLLNQQDLGLKLYESSLKKLIEDFLPKNIERCQDILQVNLLLNIINILNYICHANNEGGDSILNSSLCQVLLKICLIQVPVKEGFRYYGLNRILGNNQDLKKFDIIIPKDHDKLNNAIISSPAPIINFKESNSNMSLKHEYHLFELNIAIIKTIENYLLRSINLAILQNKDTVKVIIMIIKRQQTHIFRSPRSKLISQQITVISKLLRILNYLFKFETELGIIIYSDSLVELVIILLTIAFGSESLVSSSNQLIKHLRMKNYKGAIFNKAVESRARATHHLSSFDDKQDIIDAETDYPNGLEYPYDNDTIELSREILAKVINTEAADNLYININT